MITMAKINCGSSRIILLMIKASVGRGRRETKPRQAPLARRHIIQARNARIYRPLNMPLRKPSETSILATPFFRHLARPRAAEKNDKVRLA